MQAISVLSLPDNHAERAIILTTSRPHWWSSMLLSWFMDQSLWLISVSAIEPSAGLQGLGRATNQPVRWQPSNDAVLLSSVLSHSHVLHQVYQLRISLSKIESYKPKNGMKIMWMTTWRWECLRTEKLLSQFISLILSQVIDAHTQKVISRVNAIHTKILLV